MLYGISDKESSRQKDVRRRERETRDELQVIDQEGSSGGSGHEEDPHACLMIVGKTHPVEEQCPKL